MTTYVYLDGEEIKVLDELIDFEEGMEFVIMNKGETAQVTVTMIEIILLVVDNEGDMVQNVYVEKL